MKPKMPIGLKPIKTIVFSLSLLVSFVLILLSHSLHAQNDVLVDGIIGIVGNKIVLHSDIEIQYQQSLAQGMSPDESIKCQIFDQLMMEKLLINQAELDSIVVTEDEIEIEIDNRFRYYISLLGSEEKFEEYFNKTVLEFKDEFRPEVQQILLAKRMQEDIVSTVKVTPIEVKEFFAEIPKDSLPYFNAEVQVAEIVLNPIITKEAKEAAKAKLRDFKARILSEQNTFEELAETYSQDPGSGAQGGNLGLQSRGTYVKEFEAAAFNLKNKDEMTGIVETQFGFHLIRLIERIGNNINLQHILIKPTISTADFDLTKVKADSIRTLIVNDSISFKEAVDEYSEDENSQSVAGSLVNRQTGSTYFEMDQLDPDVFFAVESLKEGEMSQPTLVKAPDGSKQYKIFIIQSRTVPHRANLEDDYSRIQEFAQQQKQNEAMNKWITEKVENTFVQLNKQYSSCSSMIKWGN